MPETQPLVIDVCTNVIKSVAKSCYLSTICISDSILFFVPLCHEYKNLCEYDTKSPQNGSTTYRYVLFFVDVEQCFSLRSSRIKEVLATGWGFSLISPGSYISHNGSRLHSMPDTFRPWLLLTLLHISRLSQVQSFASNLIVFICDYALPKSQKIQSSSVHRQVNVSVT